MRYLNEGRSPVYIIYEPEDFADPVVCYTAIQYWMSDIGEDFFDYYGYHFHFSNFIRFLSKHEEVSKEILIKAVFDELKGEHQDISYAIQEAFKNDEIADKLSVLITDKIYQLFAVYVSERAYTKLYHVIINGGALTAPFILAIKDCDIEYWRKEYEYLSKINLMEELANEDDYNAKGTWKDYPACVDSSEK